MGQQLNKGEKKRRRIKQIKRTKKRILELKKGK
ncbi:MAG: hypothetical protein ACD_79C01038G0002 [uncultured bacterium]|nr:MAG: hypothetical protein ACD_79C01038G0002 [uncultured bacterium]